MLDDFVTGALANPQCPAASSSPSCACSTTLAAARTGSIVFSNDAHDPIRSRVARLGRARSRRHPGRSRHPRAGAATGRAARSSRPKRAYGAFDGTGLDEQLQALGVEEVVICGQHTHICVRHSAYGALIRGYRVTIPRDAVCAFEGVDPQAALDYLGDGLRRGADRRRDADRDVIRLKVSNPGVRGLDPIGLGSYSG